MLRGRFDSGRSVPARFLFGVSADVAQGLAYMHSLGISHGDVYAHNVLVKKGKDGPLMPLRQQSPHPSTSSSSSGASFLVQDEQVKGPAAEVTEVVFARLFDFGAAFFYPPECASLIEAVEVRAFGLLLQDLVNFFHASPAAGDEDEATAAAVAYLRAVAEACAKRAPAQRPSFAAVAQALALLRDFGVARAKGELPL